eukprot:PhM_4_TR11033/c0_g1_i1/m.31467
MMSTPDSTFTMQDDDMKPDMAVPNYDISREKFSSESSKEALLAGLARQQHTIDSLHGVAKRYKTRSMTLHSDNLTLQDRIEALGHVREENEDLKATVEALQRKAAELQGTVTAMMERPVQEVSAGHILKMHAMERQLEASRTECARRVAAHQAMIAESEMLKQQIVDRDERIRLLLERRNDTATQKDAPVTVAELKAEVGLLEQRLAVANEDLARRDTVVTAQQREIKTLKNTVSSLVAQISTSCGGDAVSTAQVSRQGSLSSGGVGGGAGAVDSRSASLAALERLRKYQTEHPLRNT